MATDLQPLEVVFTSGRATDGQLCAVALMIVKVYKHPDEQGHEFEAVLTGVKRFIIDGEAVYPSETAMPTVGEGVFLCKSSHVYKSPIDVFGHPVPVYRPFN